MANREIDKLTRHDAVSAIKFISENLPNQSRTRGVDDLIVSLSNAYENKRARQVHEWETRQKTHPDYRIFT